LEKKKEPRLEKLDIVEIEQIRALAHPIHHKIFKLMEEKGACEPGEIAELLDLDLQEVEEYLHGLLAIGFVDRFEEKGRECYLPVAKYYRVKKELLEKEEGLDSFKEMLINRLAGFAQHMAGIDDSTIEKSRISFHKFKFRPEDVDWALERIETFLEEMMDRSQPVLEEKSELFEMALFFYPQKPASSK